VQGLRWLKNRSLLFVNNCFEDEHNAAIVVFLQALYSRENFHQVRQKAIKNQLVISRNGNFPLTIIKKSKNNPS